MKPKSTKPQSPPDTRRKPGGEPGRERHSGHGADSALKQMRVWEQRRAAARTPSGGGKPSAN